MENLRYREIFPFTLDRIEQGDSIDWMTHIPDESIHMILSDIPYGIGTENWDVLHNNTNTAYLGTSPAQKRAGNVFKRRGKPINGWSEADRAIPQQYYEWCLRWTASWHRVLKPGGSAIIFAGRRLAHRCVCAMEDSGFSLKDTLAWLRDQAPHRAQRISVIYERRGNNEASKSWEGWRVGNLCPKFEPILWFTKPYKIGTTIADNVLKYGVGAYNQEAFLKYAARSENILECGFSPGEGGLHPTQKPIRLMQALIELCTLPNQIVLDPFAGSGTTLVAAKMLDRRYLGCELEPEYIDVCKKRLKEQLVNISMF